jgi:hypothetical protein
MKQSDGHFDEMYLLLYRHCLLVDRCFESLALSPDDLACGSDCSTSTLATRPTITTL